MLSLHDLLFVGAEYVDENTMIPQNSTVLVHRLAGHPTDAINTSYRLLSITIQILFVTTLFAWRDLREGIFEPGNFG
jgi:hypothetical protein